MGDQVNDRRLTTTTYDQRVIGLRRWPFFSPLDRMRTKAEHMRTLQP